MIDKIYIPTIGRNDRQITWNNLPQKWKDKTVLVVDSSDKDTYDKPTITLPDDVKRMLMIIKETERLASLSGEELEDWLRKAQSICEFNFNLLWSKQDFYHRLNY